MKSELLRLEYLDVTHKGNPVLENFSMELFEGDILGILAKNTRETDVLIDVLSGEKIPEKGRISFRGEPLQTRYPGKNSPIIVVGRKSQLIDNFNIADNIFVIRRGFRKFYVQRRQLEIQAEMMLGKMGIGLSPVSYAKDLTVLEKLVVEIAKCRILRVPVVVLKSLSSFLSDEDLGRFEHYLDLFRVAGQTFIVMDSTSNIVKNYCSRIIILHKGRNLWTFRAGEFSEVSLARFFPMEEEGPLLSYEPESRGEVIFSLENLSAGTMASLNCRARRGEIRVLLDPEGSRIEEIRKILTGEKRDYRGNVVVKGSVLRSLNPHRLLKRNIALISEDPAETQLCPQFNGLDNLVFSMGQKVPIFWQRRKFRENILLRYEPYFSPGALWKNLKKLTPRDLQTLSYLRWHLYAPDLVVLVKPFSSVDGQLEDLTISLMSLLLSRGIGLLILTSNLWELSALSEKLPVKIQRLPPLT